MSTPIEGVIVSDFNIANFSALLNLDEAQPQVTARMAPFGPVVPSLVNSELPCWDAECDFAVVWSRPEAVIRPFADLLRRCHADPDEIRRCVDAFCAAIGVASRRVRSLFVPSWVVPPFHQGHGMLDLTLPGGISRTLIQMNLCLLEALDGMPNVFPLNTGKWIQLAGSKAFSPRLWYLGKIPFSDEVFRLAAADIKAALRGIRGRSRKLIVLDLDDTLWGGVVGEVGWERIRLGGHDAVGEAFVDFQHELKALTRQGVILAIVSKNEEKSALAAIDRHPEMVLRRSDFAGWRINWSDKAANLAALAQELNLGLESVVFIDDNPVERARVRETFPEVLVPEWPSDPRFYPQAVLSLDCFDKPVITGEDRDRPQMYATDRQRAELRSQVGSFDEWLRTLSVTVIAQPLSPADLSRAAQLLNKTNQFNLSTRRMSEAELSEWAACPEHMFWTFRVTDRLGDSGLTGLLGLQWQGQEAEITDFVLSCRVMGRKVEETMMGFAVTWAQKAGLDEIFAVYKPTSKNKPCLEFLHRSGFQASGDGVFRWGLFKAYPDCPHVRLMDQTLDSAIPAAASAVAEA
jgi:FkbH-like protein